MSGFAPYGYMKDPADKHHFLIDEEAAKVVRRIFYMSLEGYSRDGIARKLNQEGVMTPSEYKRKVQGLKYTNALEKSSGKGWAYPTINVILRIRVYTGAMVQHKSEKISYKVENIITFQRNNNILLRECMKQLSARILLNRYRKI